MNPVEIAGFEIRKKSCDSLVRVVVPGRGIGCGSAESAQSHVTIDFSSEVPAIYRWQARGAGNGKPAKARDVGGIRALIVQADVICAIDPVGQGLELRAVQPRIRFAEAASPVSREIPVRVGNMGHVRLNLEP